MRRAFCLAVIGGLLVEGLSAGLPVEASLPLPDQASIVVTGSSLSAVTTSPPALTPTFTPSATDYVMYCAAGVNAITITLTAASGTITVGSTTASTIPLTVNLQENQAITIQAPDPTAGTDTYWVRCLPHDFPHLTVTKSSAPPAGWYVTGNITASSSAGSATYAMILDTNGTPVWYHKAPGGAIDVQRLASNQLAWAPLLGPGIGANPNGGYSIYGLDTQASMLVKAPIGPTDPHEFLPMSNGHRMMIGTPLKGGYDLSSFVTKSAAFQGVTTIVDCVVQELDAQGNLIWSWKASDHFDLSEARDTSPFLSQIQTVNGTQAADIFHCNSVDLDPTAADPSQANVLVSLRHLNAVVLINRATGSVIWKMGGTTSNHDGALIVGITDAHGPFSGQHDARFEPGGDVSLYDDHTGQTAPPAPFGAARAVEYSINITANTASASNVFEFASPDGKNSLATGSFRRYSSGADNIVDWGFKPGAGFTEFDGSGNQIMNVHFTNGEVEYRTRKEPAGNFDINLLRASAGMPRSNCGTPSVGGAGTGGGSTSFYFAEGFTGSGFQECLALLMPKASGLATIDYWTASAHTTGTVQLTAGQLTLVNVNQVVGADQDVSVRVTLPAPGIVEREMYFNNGSWNGSDDVVGVAQPATEWDFAEGSTLPAFNEFLSLFNPNSTAAAVTLNYQLDTGDHPVKQLSVPPGRTTIEVYQGDLSDNPSCDPLTSCGVGPGYVGVSVQVTSDQAIVAERPMYVANYSFGSGPIRDGDVAFGANSASTSWLFAEGTTLPGFNEYLSLQNPGAADATVTLNYLDDLGSQQLQLVVGAHSRQTAIVSDPSHSGVAPGQVGVSVSVSSDQPIVAERPIYIYRTFTGNGATAPVAGVHDALGATVFGTLFGFSAADTIAGNNDYITIQNAQSLDATITLDYYLQTGMVQKTIVVPHGTRHTVLLFANNGEGIGPQANPFGITVGSTQSVLVEKPTYSSLTPTYGATDTMGYSSSGF